jgi:hypothetical protein
VAEVFEARGIGVFPPREEYLYPARRANNTKEVRRTENKDLSVYFLEREFAILRK